MPVILQQPPRIVLGAGCSVQCLADASANGWERMLLLTCRPLRGFVDEMLRNNPSRPNGLTVMELDDCEPTVAMFQYVLTQARTENIDAVIGVGGGSVLDVAKIVAVLVHTEQTLEEVFGIGRVAGRVCGLACVPTTAGTGAEVSPNALLIDEVDGQKKAVISRYIVPDAAYIDPSATLGLPPATTASTGLDALTHCIEAFTNRFAHPAVDLYALEGTRLIMEALPLVLENGNNADARDAMARGSFYGGLCLGPVNTAAVHALAYPLGTMFHVPHGLSNALLLPHVLRFNSSVAGERLAALGRAIGARSDTSKEAGKYFVERVSALIQTSPIPHSLKHVGVPHDALPVLAPAAMKVTRLLRNNPREVTLDDAIQIYEAAY